MANLSKIGCSSLHCWSAKSVDIFQGIGILDARFNSCLLHWQS